MHFTEEGVEDIERRRYCGYVYENSGYGCGESKDGVSLTLLLHGGRRRVYAFGVGLVYSLLDDGEGQRTGTFRRCPRCGIALYGERAWNGEKVTYHERHGASQAVDAMAESVEDYPCKRLTDVAENEAVAGEGTDADARADRR